MSETEKDVEIKVNDRRRFDPDGKPRAENGDGGGPHTGSDDVSTGGQAEPASPAPQNASAEELQAVRAELETARRRVDELARAYQALTREREDFKQRLTRERERLLDVEKGNVALTLLEAVDDLDLCLSASANDTSPLATGVRMIRDGLLAKLQSTGIERIDLVGQSFDPNVAEAADMEITDKPENDQKIVGEVRAGYRLKDRVVRPARVKVAKYVKPAEA